MTWRKQGLVYAPSGELWWAREYATIPAADVLDEKIIRVYFAGLDENKFGRIGYVELDAQNPKRILYETREPVLDIGALGSFEDSGVNASCVVNVGAMKYLYYIGWQRAERVPYMLFTGLAKSNDNGKSFQKYARTPILDRTTQEPFSRSAPFVMLQDGLFKIWYWTCEEWSIKENWVHYNNVIRYAESSDGIHFPEQGALCIAPHETQDYAVGRPWVIRDADVYRMWFSTRSRGAEIPYRIEYAESADGMHWARKPDAPAITVSADGWDSEMISYPCVVDTVSQRYLFYNGNRHGATGFGLAVWEA